MRHFLRTDYGAISLILGLLSVLVSLITFFGWQAHQGDSRCESIGGQTWDHGYHCIVGDYNVVNVR